MAAKCGNCRSTDVTTLCGDNVSCLKCGTTGPNAEGTPLPDDKPAKKTAPKKGKTGTKDVE